MARMQRSVAEGMLSNAPSDKRFWCHNGQVFQNLEELAEALAGLDEDSFRYHVNESKNDFSSWVREVIGDEKLARDLEKSLTPAQASRRVATRIQFLKERAAG